MAEQTCVIGKQISVNGHISGKEDLIIEGRVEGQITLGNHLTIRPQAVALADVEAESLTVEGELRGKTHTAKAITIGGEATVIGNLRAQRISIAEGARYAGRIEMDVKLPAGIKAP